MGSISERFVCPGMALYKHCIYFLFVLSCVTDCFRYVVIAVCQWPNKDAVCFVFFCLFIYFEPG